MYRFFRWREEYLLPCSIGLLHRCSSLLWSGEVVAAGQVHDESLMEWLGVSFSTNSTFIDDAGLQMGIISLLNCKAQAATLLVLSTNIWPPLLL